MIKYKVQKNVKPSIVELKIIKTLKQNNDRLTKRSGESFWKRH